MDWISTLESRAELAEAWAVAFEARWPEERAAAEGVREAGVELRALVQSLEQVRDQMEHVAMHVAREARVTFKVRL